MIRITRFSHGVAGAVRRAARDAPVVVLDLRGNPGGLISEAVATVDVFLENGRIVSYSGAHTLGETVTAGKSALPRMPLVVVVDRAHRERGRDRRRRAAATTSAPRSSARARSARPRSRRSSPVAGGGAVKLTVATYRTPNGLDIHGRGVRPDVPVRTQAARARGVRGASTC